MTSQRPHRVGIVRTESADYPREAPFHPSTAYPEYPFGPDCVHREPNPAYAGVRDLLRVLGYDAERFGQPGWNPLGHVIEPGMKVVIKPNFVLSRHAAGGDLFSIITHPSVLRAVADYCWIALQGRGRIVIADAPQYDCNPKELVERTGMDRLVGFYRSAPGSAEDGENGVDFAFRDLRRYWSAGKHFDSERRELPGDPEGVLTVDLGPRSAMEGKRSIENLYGAVYHRSETIRHHSGGHHEYEVSRTVMDADVFVSVPKLKVHKKVGTTLNAKGLVGIATNKNFLVHYTLKPPSEGGDQYPDELFTPVEQRLIRLERWMYDNLLASRQPILEMLHRSIYWIHNHSTKLLGLKVQPHKRLLDAGNWHGNDSAWRMTADLVDVLHFADRDGKLQPTQQRRTFTVIDGIVGGERNGPLTPDAVRSSVLIGGESLVAADLVATRLMGFRPLALRLYRRLLEDPNFDLGVHDVEDVEVLCEEPAWQDCLHDENDPMLGFEPHPGWVGEVEVGHGRGGG